MCVGSAALHTFQVKVGSGSGILLDREAHEYKMAQAGAVVRTYRDPT